jgi:von Willebrand factor type A domain
MKVSHFILGAAGLAVGLTLSLDARAQSCDPPRILFVIDSSSSMLDEANATTTKWQAAQDAVHAVLTDYGDVAQYGLMTFPGEAGGCTTGSVLVDVDAGTASSIESNLAALDMQASRSTPAGQSLVAASNYAGITDSNYNNYVVFVSDGWQYCSLATSSAPICASAADGALMGEDPPLCNSCSSASTDPACSGQSEDGCYCIRNWPVLGVESLNAAGVTTYVVGFGAQVDDLTLNAAANTAGTALPGCDPNTSNCFYEATEPADLNAALADIVQQVVVDTCVGPCDIPGQRTCTASGWSDCDAPSTISCTSACNTTGTQECVNNMLTECDAVCPDAGGGGAGGAGGGAGAGGAAGAGATGGAGGEGGTAATGGTGGGTAGTGGPGTIDAGADDSGAAAGPSTTGDTADAGDDGGCACRAGRSNAGGASALFAALAAIGLALFRRRR